MITAYKLSDGLLFENNRDALRHLEKLEQPHADKAIKLMLACNGKAKNFIALVQDVEFLEAAVKLYSYMQERTIIDE